jgi:hypothetical protein
VALSLRAQDLSQRRKRYKNFEVIDIGGIKLVRRIREVVAQLVFLSQPALFSLL